MVPINTPLLLLILGSIIASLCKVLDGGFGRNKLNPTVLGMLFITILFSNNINSYLNPYELNNINIYSIPKVTNTSLINLFLGNVPGGLGTTSGVLSILAFIYLTYNKVIKWRLSISYILTIIIMSFILCLTKNISLYFIIYNILSNSLLFYATYIISDSTTTPLTNMGQLLGGIISAFLTMTLRYLGYFYFDILIPIIILNILTIIINYFDVRLYRKKTLKKVFVGVIIISITLSSIYISRNIEGYLFEDKYYLILN